jgi:low temperature requirement protein LtrA
MNIAEGSRRMRSAGRTFLLASLGTLTLSLLCLLIPVFVPQYIQAAGNVNFLTLFCGLSFYLCAIALVLGVVLWLAGWIVEGFAQPAP